jgi:hypothetical protein
MLAEFIKRSAARLAHPLHVLAVNILVVDDIDIEKKTGKKPTPLALHDATLVSAIATPAVRKRYVQDWATNNNLVLDSELVANLTNATILITGIRRSSVVAGII